MCRGDPSLATFSWVNNTILKSRVYSSHECVDWERLEEWATSRMIDVSNRSILTRNSRDVGVPEMYPEKEEATSMPQTQ